MRWVVATAVLAATSVPAGAQSDWPIQRACSQVFYAAATEEMELASISHSVSSLASRYVALSGQFHARSKTIFASQHGVTFGEAEAAMRADKTPLPEVTAPQCLKLIGEDGDKLTPIEDPTNRRQ